MRLFIQNNIKVKLGGVILFLIIILFSFSCKKDQIPEYNVVDSIKSYVSFKEGSYWIYKDDSTGIEDSVWVTSFKPLWRIRSNSDGEVEYKYETITCSMATRNSNFTGELGAKQNVIGISLFDWSFGIDFDPNFQNWNISQFYRNSIIIDSIQYNQVINFVAGLTPVSETYNYIDVYIKSNLGILKWVVKYNDGHSSQQHLVRYNLVL